MARLNELRDNPGANKKKVRVGRGIGGNLCIPGRFRLAQFQAIERTLAGYRRAV